MKKRIRFSLYLLVILVILIIGYFIFKSNKQQQSELNVNQAPLAVKLITVNESNQPQTYTTYGSLVAPFSVDLKSQVKGVIESINFSNGQWVKKGELLFKINDADILSQLATAKANLEQLTADYHRYQTLFNKAQAVSQEQLDSFKAKYQTALADYDSAEANFGHTKVAAPFDGKLGVSAVAIGSYVEVGDTLVQLVDRKDLEVEYPLPETLLGQVKMGQSVTMKTDAYPGQTFKAMVNYIAPNVNTDSLTFNVRAKFNNSKDLLSPGMNVDVTHILNPNTKVMLLPNSSLATTQKGYQVYEVVDGKAKAVNVTVGLVANNGNFIILSGVKPQDKVIEKASEVSNGMKVKVD